MIRRKLLFWIATIFGVLVLVVVSAAVYIATRSDEWWRDHLTGFLSDALGREVAIDGAFSLSLGRDLGVEAASLRFVNPDWAEAQNMVELGSILLELDLLSVLDDTLQVHRLELTDLVVALEETETGENNWTFPTAAKAPPRDKKEDTVTLPVQIGQFSLADGRLTLTQPKRTRPIKVQLDSLTAGQTADDYVVLDGKGRLGDLGFELAGRVGEISSLLNAGPFTYEIKGDAGEIRLRGNGSFDSLAPATGPRLDLDLSGPDIAWVTDFLGSPRVAEGPFECNVDIASVGRGVEAALRGKFGKLELQADVSSEDLSNADNLNASARFSGENLAAFAELVGLPPLPSGAFKVDAILVRDDGATRIDQMTATVGEHQLGIEGVVGAWPEFENTSLEVRAEGPDLSEFNPTVALIHLGELPPGAYTVDALVASRATGLLVRGGEVTAGGYRATAEGPITIKDGFRAELDVTGSGPDLSMVSRIAKILPLPALPFDASGRIDITAKDITLIGTSGTAGEHEVAADGPIAFSPQGPLRLDVRGTGPSLHEVLEGIGYAVIPATAEYDADGTVEFANNRLVVTAKRAKLGPAVTTSTVLTIPDVKTASTLVVEVGNVNTTDVARALALVGVDLELPSVVPADLSGKVNRSKGLTGLSQVNGTIGEANVFVDGAVGDPPEYRDTRVSLEIAGPHLEHILDLPMDQALPFRISGGISLEDDHTRFEDLQLELVSIDARVDGHVGSWETIEGTELTVSARGPDLDVIGAILDLPLPRGAFVVDGHVVGMADAFHIDRMNVQVGRSNLSGDLTLTQGEPPRLSGRVSSRYINLAALKREKEEPEESAEEDIQEVAEATEDTGTAPRRKEQRFVFPDRPIELDRLDKLDVDLDIHFAELTNFWERGSIRTVSARVLIDDGDLSVTDFDASGPSEGRVRGNLSINREAGKTRIDVELNAQKIRVGLAAAPGQDPQTYPPVDLEASLEGSGSTYRELAASLDGRIKAVQGKGRVNNTALHTLLSDVLYELFQLMNPFAKQESTTPLECSVFIVTLDDGIADVPAVVIHTDKLTIVSRGVIDLNTERLDMQLATRPRKGLGISASAITNPYIKLGGTMADTAITLAPGGAALATGAAVATGGLSILAKGFWDRFLTARDPCGRALEQDAKLQEKTAEGE